jgi:hypothetical protein
MNTLGIAMILGMMNGDARRRENEERARRGEPPLTDPFGDRIVRIAEIILVVIGWAVGILIAIMTINALWTYYRLPLLMISSATLWILGNRWKKRLNQH